MNEIKIFERRGALDILVFLYRVKEPWMVTRLMRKLEISQDAFYARLIALKEFKLIEEVKLEGVSDRHVIRLTGKGKAAAKKIDEFFDIVHMDAQTFKQEYGVS